MSSSNSSTRNFIPMANKYDRVILLVDMDCFYCQVEEKLDPSLKGKPLAVVQYNAWKGGGIIAVNYAARAKGVTRHMRGDEAKEQCPDIQLVKVPNIREKADLTKYREAGKDVANVLQRFTPLLERASVDEAYLDITDAVNKRLKEMNEGTFILEPKELINTYAVGFPTIGEFVTKITTGFISNPAEHNEELYRNFHENDIPAVRQSNIRLLIGASIASEIRNAVKMQTSYECSAGIAHNKILAKLACGINKPNKQTILPLAEIASLFETLPISKIKGLGAKFGEEICERLNVCYLGQLLKFTEADLQKKFDEKNGTWLYNICRGIDLEAVTPRFYSKSIGCCKKFPGRNNITGLKTLQHWLKELANEINERLEKDILENNRRAKQMVVNFVQEFENQEISSSRSTPLHSYDAETLSKSSLEIIKANTKQFFRAGSENVLNNPIKFLGISVGKFETISSTQNNILKMFAQQQRAIAISNDEKRQSDTNAPVTEEKTLYSENGFQKQNNLKHSSKEKNGQSVKSFFLNFLKQGTENTSESENVNKGTMNLDNIDLKSNNSSNALEEDIREPCNNKNSTRIIDKRLSIDLLEKTECVSEKSATDDENLHNKLELDIKTEEKNSDEIKPLKTSKALNNNENISKISNEILSLKDTNITNYIGSVEIKDNSTTKVTNLTKNLKYTQKELNESSYGNANSGSSSSKIDIIETVTKDPSILSTSDINFHTDNSVLNKKRKFSEISNIDIQPDYRHQYAEYAIPELRPEYLQFIDCSQCGTKIFNDPNAIQTHQDLHFAQKLSQQQRNEFRNEVQTKINSAKLSPNASNKKSKKDKVSNSSTTTKKSSNANITKFLQPQKATSSTLSQSNDCNNPNIKICDICKISVKLDDLVEHKDFHIAKDLQRKLNQLEVHTVTVVKKSASDMSRKRMNTSLNTTSHRNQANNQPITQFFTQSNT